MTPSEHDPRVEMPEVHKQQEGDDSPGTEWSRPRLERLHLSLDTASDAGSFIDGLTGSIF